MQHISQIVMASHLLKQTLNQFNLANFRLAPRVDPLFNNAAPRTS